MIKLDLAEAAWIGSIPSMPGQVVVDRIDRVACRLFVSTPKGHGELASRYPIRIRPDVSIRSSVPVSSCADNGALACNIVAAADTGHTSGHESSAAVDGIDNFIKPRHILNR